MYNTLPKPILWASLAALLSCGTTSPTGAENERPDGTAILFIGNSLTYWNDMPAMVDALLDSADTPAYVASVASPNFGLEDHWRSGAALDSIGVGGWDFVIMQQGPSATEGRPSLLEWTERFADSIRAGGAEPGLYMVWPAQTRLFDFPGVADSYRTAANRISGRLFPVGEAWQLTWERDSTIALYGPDGFHPSRAASFLAAAVISAGISGVDPRTLPTSLAYGRFTLSLGAAQGATLLEAAEEALRVGGR